jgi:hypothetical protein
MIDNDMLILQRCVVLLKVEPGSCSKTCVTSSQNENQVLDIKVDEGSVGEGEEEDEEKNPLLIPFPPVMAEYDVSFVCIDC